MLDTHFENNESLSQHKTFRQHKTPSHRWKNRSPILGTDLKMWGQQENPDILRSWSDRWNIIFTDISKPLEFRASLLSHSHWLIWLSIIPNHLGENLTCLRIHSFFYLCYTTKRQTNKQTHKAKTKTNKQTFVLGKENYK